jgi:hypothetical protein
LVFKKILTLKSRLTGDCRAGVHQTSLARFTVATKKFGEQENASAFPPARRRGSDVAEKVGAGIPEDAVEAEDHLVQVAEAEAFDRLNLPVRKRRREGDGVGQALRVLRDGLESIVSISFGNKKTVSIGQKSVFYEEDIYDQKFTRQLVLYMHVSL